MSNATLSLQASKVVTSLVAIGMRQTTNGSEHFNSDGSNHPTKQCNGLLFKLGRSRNGLKRYVEANNGKTRNMNQRMTQEVVTEVLDYIFKNNYVQVNGKWMHRKYV